MILLLEFHFLINELFSFLFRDTLEWIEIFLKVRERIRDMLFLRLFISGHEIQFMVYRRHI